MQRVSPAGIGVIGVSHRAAALADRERFHAVATRPEWQVEARQSGWLWESLVLSTCNRVEICLAAPDIDAAARHCLQIIGAAAGHAYFGLDAVRYFGRVAAGLESLVLGEHEISGQIRRAATDASAAGTAGVLIERIVAGTLRASGRVRAETDLGAGALSVAGAALGFAERELGDWRHARALVVGTGPVGREILTRWARRGHRKLSVASRSTTHAQQAAKAAGASVVAFDDVAAALGDADVAFAAVRMPGRLLDADACAKVMSSRRNRPLLIVDLSVPRAIDPRAAELEGLTLRSVDDLGAVRLAAQNLRERSIPAANAIVDQESARTFERFAARAARFLERAA